MRACVRKLTDLDKTGGRREGNAQNFIDRPDTARRGCVCQKGRGAGRAGQDRRTGLGRMRNSNGHACALPAPASRTPRARTHTHNLHSQSAPLPSQPSQPSQPACSEPVSAGTAGVRRQPWISASALRALTVCVNRHHSGRAHRAHEAMCVCVCVGALG